MAGWTSSNEIKVEKVEEILDKNPDLYKQRTIAALNEGRFRDALKEAQIALKYGNNALEYHVLILRVLFEMEQYSVCMQYNQKSNLWYSLNDSSLLEEERNYVYYVYAVCYRECGYSLDDTQTIIVTSDGKGMCASIQEAVVRCNENQNILLVNGCYEEFQGVRRFSSQYVKFSEEKILISRKRDVVIRALENVTVETRIFIENSKVKIQNIKFYDIEDRKYIIHVKDSKVKLSKVEFSQGSKRPYEGLMGVLVSGNSELHVRNSLFYYIPAGIYVENGAAYVDECKFAYCKVGFVTMCKSKDWIIGRISDSEFCNNTRDGGGTGVLVTQNSNIEVINCKVYDNTVGLSLSEGSSIRNPEAGKMLIKECEIHHNGANVVLNHSGKMKIQNSIISGASQNAITAVGNVRLELTNCHLKRNRIDINRIGNPIILETGVTREDNHVVGATVEGVKGTLNSISNMAYGKDFTVAGATKDILGEVGELAVDLLGKLFK